MGYITKIEWTTHTFNPWWGCTKVSAGCDFCYAEAWAGRFGNDVWGDDKPRRVMSDNYWREPFKWNTEAERTQTRTRVFCASMADVFDKGAPEGQLDRLWELIRRTPWLDWQLLTKRPQRIAKSLPADWGDKGYPNVWLGTSVEDGRVLRRIQFLTAVPAYVHFLSLEPLIGPLPNLPLKGIEWAIVGGESGVTPRPMEKQWVRDIREQCEVAGTAFFFKQWGGTNATKKANGRELDGRTYSDFPVVEYPIGWPFNIEPVPPVTKPTSERLKVAA